MMRFLLFSTLLFTCLLNQAQSPLMMTEFPQPDELRRFYQQRNIKAAYVFNFRMRDGDTLRAGVYRTQLFDEEGRIIYDSTGTVLGRCLQYNYDAMGRLDSMSKRTGKGLGYTLFSYNAQGQCAQELEISHRKDTNSIRYYSYDHQGRKVEEREINPATKSLTQYHYDEAGNMVEYETTTTTIKGDVQTSRRFLYDQNGRLTGIRGMKDANVRLVNNYFYDNRGRLTEVSRQGKGEIHQYHYRSDGLLLRMEVYDRGRKYLKGWQVYQYE